MSQIWFGGIGAGGGAFGAGEAYPVLVHSVRAQFCPIPQAPFPLAILTYPPSPQLSANNLYNWSLGTRFHIRLLLQHDLFLLLNIGR